MTCISFQSVDVAFGAQSKHALALLDQGLSREDIQKQTQSWIAIQSISFDLLEGEILVIMGLSGSGKSTLLRCTNGLNRSLKAQTRGKILYQGIDLLRCSRASLREVQRHHISMVFQQFALMPWRTVSENIEFGLEIQGIPKPKRRESTDNMLEMIGMKEWANHRPHQLSGGMQQRVGLARALVTQAPILLMDEPFSALDPLIRRRLQDEIRELQKNLKKTILFVTHDFDEALRIGDRMILMDNGKILQMGKPSEIIAAPASERVREFIHGPKDSDR